VAESTVTLVTVAPIPLARGRVAKVLMADSRAAPFCSSLTLSASGVLELKNFSQFALICAAASAVDPVPGLLGAAEVAAGDDGGALDGEAVVVVLELLQAAIVAASARPSAGAAIRRARRWDRMTRLLCLGRVNW
jgi:hypothetical protein